MKKTFYLLAAAFAAFCCASCTDDAEPVITVESVTIQTSQLTLMPGETAQLEATVTPSDAANSDVSLTGQPPPQRINTRLSWMWIRAVLWGNL